MRIYLWSCFIFFILTPKEYFSAMVRKNTLDQKRDVFGLSDPRPNAWVRPAGQMKTTRGSCWPVGSDEGIFNVAFRVKEFSNLTGRVGSGQELFKCQESGRVGLGQEVMKNSRVGSGHDARETVHSRVWPT